MAISFNAQILAVLSARGVTGRSLVDYEIVDFGAGPVIAKWDVAKLGAQPTPAQLAAVTEADATAANAKNRRDKTLWTPQITALTKAVHDRLRAANVDTVQMGPFRAAIEAQYDLLVP